MRAAEKLSGESVLRINFPASASTTPRWGYGKPPHPQMLALLESGRGEYSQVLQAMEPFLDDLRRIPVAQSDAVTPAWRQTWIPPLDASLIYTALRTRKPRTIVEVGSGWSTRFAARAIADGGLTTSLVSIDPEPRAEISALGTKTFRSPLESVDLSVFDELEAGDIVFVDCSHRVFTNSDVTVFFLDALPRIKPGVLVGVHDILWPLDYAPGWSGYHFSEQYLLAGMLLGGSTWLKVAFPSFYAAGCPELFPASGLGQFCAEQKLPLWGTSFWLDVNERPSR